MFKDNNVLKSSIIFQIALALFQFCQAILIFKWFCAKTPYFLKLSCILPQKQVLLYDGDMPNLTTVIEKTFLPVPPLLFWYQNWHWCSQTLIFWCLTNQCWAQQTTQMQPRWIWICCNCWTRAKTQARDPETMEMVEAAYGKLKDHLWYLRERLVLMTLFSARVADRDKKEMASAVPK